MHLTDTGQEVAEKIYERHQFFTKLLIDAGMDKVIAEQDACRIEHVISEESFQRIKEKLGLLTYTPNILKTSRLKHLLSFSH